MRELNQDGLDGRGNIMQNGHCFRQKGYVTIDTLFLRSRHTPEMWRSDDVQSTICISFELYYPPLMDELHGQGVIVCKDGT